MPELPDFSMLPRIWEGHEKAAKGAVPDAGGEAPPTEDWSPTPRTMDRLAKQRELAAKAMNDPHYYDPVSQFWSKYASPFFKNVFAAGPQPLPVEQDAAERQPLVDHGHPVSQAYQSFRMDNAYARYQALQEKYGDTAEGRSKAGADPELQQLAEEIKWAWPTGSAGFIDESLRVGGSREGGGPDPGASFESAQGDFAEKLFRDFSVDEVKKQAEEARTEAEKGLPFAEQDWVTRFTGLFSGKPILPEEPGAEGGEPASMLEWAGKAKELQAKYPNTLEGRRQAMSDPELQLALIAGRGVVEDALTGFGGFYKGLFKAIESSKPLRRDLSAARRIARLGRTAPGSAPSFDHLTMRGPGDEVLPEVPEPEHNFDYDTNPSANGLRLLRAQDKAMGGPGEVTAIRSRDTGGDILAWPAARGDHDALTQAVTGHTIEPGLTSPEAVGAETSAPNLKLAPPTEEQMLGGRGEENSGFEGNDRLTDTPLHEQRVAVHSVAGDVYDRQGVLQAEVFRQKMAADRAGISPQGAAAIAVQHPDDVDATYAALRRQNDKEEPFSFTGMEEKAGRPPSLAGAAMDVLTSIAQTPLAMLGALATTPKAVWDSYSWLRQHPYAAWSDGPDRSVAYRHALTVAGALNVSEVLGVTQAEGSITLGAGAVRGGVKTFHGSPHKWDTIDPSKAGTGEGTAMFGWGFYSAEAPNVAKSYKGGVPGMGNLYEVQINRRPEEYLDLDKTLREQSPAVQQALAGLGFKPGERLAPDAAIETQQYVVDKLTRHLRERATGEGGATWKSLQVAQRKLKMMQGGAADLTGDEIYKQMVTDNDNNMKVVSAKLEAAGIPGARFLDQQSRDSANLAKTHNFVSFNPTMDTTVLTRNGQQLRAGEVADLQLQEIGIGPQAARMAVAAAATDPSSSRAITAVNLRALPYPVALRVAKTERHIIPGQEGQYVGAPRGMASPQKLSAMRRGYDKSVDAGVDGSKWYSIARGAINDVAGMEPARQSLLARQWALFSPQANVDANLGFQLAAHNAWLAGHPLDIAHTGAQARTFNTAMDTGTEIELGAKTGVFAHGLDPTMPPSTTGTNDIWQGRAFGYDAGEVDRAFSPQEHAFMDAETVLATDRANKRGAGGRSDWTPSETQAAAWVATKGRSDGEKFFASKKNTDPRTGARIASKEEAIFYATKQAARTYPDFFPKYTAFITEESVPYIKSGHMAGLQAAPEDVRKAYGDAASWRDIQGRDRLAGDLGMFVRSSGDAHGIYHPPGGAATEFNPMTVGRPMVGFSGPTGARTVDRGSGELLDSIGAIKGYMGVQGAVPWHLANAKNNMKNAPGYRVPMGRMVSHEEMAKLDELLGPQGLMPVHTGDGITVMPFEMGDPGPITRALKGGLAEQIKQVLPDARSGSYRAGISGGYPSFEDELTLERQGTGVATQKLFDIIDKNPEIVRRMDESPSIRDVARKQFDRDANIWKWEHGETGAAREDIQNAREIMMNSDRPLSALRDALKAGEIALPAVLLYAIYSAKPGDRT